MVNLKATTRMRCMKSVCTWFCCGVVVCLGARPALAEGDWEITPASEAALKRGLDWLAKNQGPDGNWNSRDLGLVSMGALAFLSAGHSGTVGYGASTHKALDFVVKNAKPSGLLNVNPNSFYDMYNHGLSTFVLGQAYGRVHDPRIGPVLDRALKFIVATQCQDGGWDYVGKSQAYGHDLSLAVMQAKALRSAVDSGLEVPPQVIAMAIKSVRAHYCPADGNRAASEAAQRLMPGAFTYAGAPARTTAMAAAGVVCLQEFGQYDDWRIVRSMDTVIDDIKKLPSPTEKNGRLPVTAYTLYYVGQALYQLGGKNWQENYPKLRDSLIACQATDGSWQDSQVEKVPGQLYGTAVACFILAMPNRYLPILQEGKIDSLRAKLQDK